jgi:hypothetical protein
LEGREYKQREKEAECSRSIIYSYENGKMTSIETIPGTGIEGNKRE